MVLLQSWIVKEGVLVRPGRTAVVPPGSGVNRDTLVYGTYRPSALTTGHTGTLTDLGTPATQNATLPDVPVLENRLIYGDIKWKGTSDITLKNCMLVGGSNPPASASAVVDCNATHQGRITLIDCTITPRDPRNRDCIVGHNWSAYRCNLSAGIDGAGIFTTSGTNADVVMMGNWTHDLSYVYPDYRNGVSGATWHTDGSHNDGVQMQGGRNVHLKGNFIDLVNSNPAPTNSGPNPDKEWLSVVKGNNGSGLIVQDNTGAGIDNTVIVEQNWFRGSLTQINIKPNMRFIFRNNRHFREVAINDTGLPGKWNGYWIRLDQREGAVITGLETNVWEDGPFEGQPLVEPRDSGIHYNV